MIVSCRAADAAESLYSVVLLNIPLCHLSLLGNHVEFCLEPRSHMKRSAIASSSLIESRTDFGRLQPY